MRLPERDDLRELSGKSAVEFAIWLKVGLFEYLFEKAGRRAFPGAENFVEQQDDISEDLAQIAMALCARDLQMFKEACEITLRELDFNIAQEAIVAEEVMRLGAKVRATGMLEVLSNKSFRILPDSPSSALYDLAFEFARDLADFGKQTSVDCLLHLIRSPGFRPALSGQALVALTEADPSTFADHYDCLREALNQKFGYSVVLEDEVTRPAQRRQLISSISARVVDQQLLLHPCLPSESSRPEVTNWWFETLRGEFQPLYNRLRDLSHAKPIRVTVSRPPVARRLVIPSRKKGETDFFRRIRDALGDVRPLIPSDVAEFAR
jgi:hypothetical protein